MNKNCQSVYHFFIEISDPFINGITGVDAFNHQDNLQYPTIIIEIDGRKQVEQKLKISGNPMTDIRFGSFTITTDKSEIELTVKFKEIDLMKSFKVSNKEGCYLQLKSDTHLEKISLMQRKEPTIKY